jgi:hypothetical protein
MDGLIALLVLLLVVLGAALVVLPIVATVLAVRARRQARDALASQEQLEVRVRKLELAQRAGQVERRVTPISAPLELPLPPTEAAAPAPTSPDVARRPEVAPAAPQVPASPPAPTTPPPTTAVVPPPASTLEAPPPGPKPAGPPPTLAPKAPSTLEEKIGLVWLTRLGAILGIAAAGWFFKYMVDNDWIGPWGRVALGALAGCGLLVWSEFLDRKGRVHAVFVQGLMGLGLAVLLVSAYASFAFYHLVPLGVAFGSVVVLCALGGALAWRHRAEAILGLALLAALANPIMLSTGVDRPLALFSYLLLVTGGALFLCVRLQFQLALAGAVLGVIGLFIGWYATFFDAHAAWAAGAYDLPPGELQGPYFHLLTRWSPLAAAALFPLLWLATAWRLLVRGQRKLGLALALTALTAAHAAATALLYDHAVLLAAVMCALALGSAAFLVWQRATAWLGLPMAFSFLVLMGLTDEAEAGHLLPLLALAGTLTALYAGVVVWTARREGWLARGKALWLLAGAGLGLALVGGLWLVEHHPVSYAWLVTGLSGLLLVLAVFARSAILLGCLLPASLLGLASAADPSAVEPGLIAAASVWCLLYVGALGLDLFVFDAPWTRARQALLTGAGVGYLAFILLATPEAATTLRAGLALGTGLLYLLVGLRARAEGPAVGGAALLPLGLAVAAFSLALSLLLAGPSLTIAWAIEGALLAWLAAREAPAQPEQLPGHPIWLAGALAVLCMAGLHLLSVDAPWLTEQYWEYESSGGQRGLMLATPFGHPLAWALLGLAVALLVSARAFRGARARLSFRLSALASLVLAQLCLLALAIHETRLALTPAPSLPTGLPAEELSALISSWQALVDQAATRLDMSTTLVLGLYALTLLGLGFGLRDRLHRLLGLGLFGVTLLKLGLYDIWSLGTLYRIAVGGGLAALLLTGAFLYGRFAGRIRELLTSDGGKQP